jgi:hypothetical protein
MKAFDIHHAPGQAHVMVEPGDATRYCLSLTALPQAVDRELGRACLFRMAIGNDIVLCVPLEPGLASPEWVLEHFGKSLGGCAEYNARAYCWFFDRLGPALYAAAATTKPGTRPLAWKASGLHGLFRREVRGIRDEET